MAAVPSNMRGPARFSKSPFRRNRLLLRTAVREGKARHMARPPSLSASLFSLVAKIASGFSCSTPSAVTTGATTFIAPNTFWPPHTRMASLMMLAPLMVYSGLSHTW